MDSPEFDWPTRFRRFFLEVPRRENAPTWFEEHCDSMEDRTQDESFLNAADNLVQDLIDHDHRQDTTRELAGLVYPILYCYRHYLEVALKRVVRIYKEIDLDDVAVDSALQRHNLHELWKLAKDFMDKYCPPFKRDSAETTFTDAVVKAFHTIDAGSFVFRYSHDRQGERRTRTTIPPSDLLALRKDMRELANFFAAHEDVVWEIRNTREDAHSGW